MRPEIFTSVDIETDGPCPGVNSMLSFGCAAYTADKKLVSVYTANLETLPGAMENPETMKWWATQQEAWKKARENQRSPEKVMPEFVAWLKKLENPVFVGYPAGFDFSFTYYYLMRFAGESPFSFSGIDIKTYCMAVLGLPYRESTKKNMPKDWFDKNLKHTHTALDDAIEQGALFINMLNWNLKRRGKTI